MIREMMKEDLHDIEKIMRGIDGFWDEKWEYATLDNAFDVNNGLHYVFIINNSIVGFILAYDLGFRGYISKLAVVAEHQKKHIGSKLIEYAIEQFKLRGRKLIIVDVLPHVADFYKSIGWVEPYSKILKINV